MRRATLLATFALPLALAGFFALPRPGIGPSVTFDARPATTYVWDCHVDPGITASLAQLAE
jgi:hypothetical protein